MASVSNVMRSLLVSLGTFGSLFIKKNVDGKYEIAIAPIVVVFAVGSGMACVAQKDEPFRECVKSNMTLFQEVIHAN